MLKGEKLRPANVTFQLDDGAANPRHRKRFFHAH